jgi:hypothetical protein
MIPNRTRWFIWIAVIFSAPMLPSLVCSMSLCVPHVCMPQQMLKIFRDAQIALVFWIECTSPLFLRCVFPRVLADLCMNPRTTIRLSNGRGKNKMAFDMSIALDSLEVVVTPKRDGDHERGLSGPRCAHYVRLLGPFGLML